MAAVIYEKRGNTAYITINRPKKMNAMNAKVHQGLAEAWEKVANDAEVWSVIVTGAGHKAFSAGFDLVEMTQRHKSTRRKEGDSWEHHKGERPTSEIWKPIIAAINGYCLGEGLELALQCDIRIAAEHAIFGLPEVLRGITPQAGGIQRLPRTIPFGIALELMLTGDRIDAQRAYQLGLVNKVIPLTELMPTAEALADRLNKGARLAIMAIKEAAYKGIELPLEQALKLDHRIAASRTSWTEDSQEGPEAFTKKRKAIFKGK